MLALNLMGESFSVSTLPFAAIFLALSFFLLFLFFRQKKKDSNPILDMALLKSKPFLAANLYNMIIGAGVFAVFAFVPLYATSVHGLSTLMSGMILTPRSLGVIPASAVTSFLLRRWGYRWPMVLGLSILSLTTIFLGQGLQVWRIMGIHLGIAEILAFLIMLSGIGMGIALPASNNACIELMPEKVATITGLRGMFRTVGGALGVSLITIILHSTSDLRNGFSITFISFGLGLLVAIPLVFLMPAGKKKAV
jgi:MFS family permease